MFSICIDLLLSTPLYLSKREFRAAFLRNKDKFQGKVLDLGCGSMPFKKFLDNSHYVGIDYTQKNYPDICAVATRLPFKNKSFDTVVCSEVLEHLAEPFTAIFESYRVIKPGGILYITVPMTWYLHYEPNDFYRFTKYGIRYLCEKGGFNVISIERMGGFTMYFCLRMSEFFNKVLSKYIFAPLCLFGIRLGIRKRLATIILVPYQLIALWAVFLFDRFSPIDARGWIVLATRADSD